MVPDTCLRSGPAVVVKRADNAFSGKSDLRRAVRPAVEEGAALSSGLVFAFASAGTSMPKSAMIWSAVRRRSLDLSGESGLIYHVLVGLRRILGRLPTVGFFLNMVTMSVIAGSC
jgi:hypothetical protein